MSDNGTNGPRNILGLGKRKVNKQNLYRKILKLQREIFKLGKSTRKRNRPSQSAMINQS